jgi:hypothetical protein
VLRARWRHRAPSSPLRRGRRHGVEVVVPLPGAVHPARGWWPDRGRRRNEAEEERMAFDIEVAGTLQRTVRRRLSEIVGGDAVREWQGHIVVSAGDQAAMIGLLHRLNDLGLDIQRIERTDRPRRDEGR